MTAGLGAATTKNEDGGPALTRRLKTGGHASDRPTA